MFYFHRTGRILSDCHAEHWPFSSCKSNQLARRAGVCSVPFYNNKSSIIPDPELCLGFLHWLLNSLVAGHSVIVI